MKIHLLFIAGCCIFAMNCFSQNSLAVQAGGNFGFVRQTEIFIGGTGPQVRRIPHAGLLVGVKACLPEKKSISFCPELNFVQRGFKTKTNPTDGREEKATLNYIELPLNVIYNIKGTGKRIFFGLGLTPAWGFSGKRSVKTTYSGNYHTRIKFDGDESAVDGDEHLHAIDVGLDLLAGYQFSRKIFIDINYTFGLVNLIPESKDVKFLTRSIAFKFGYLIWTGKK